MKAVVSPRKILVTCFDNIGDLVFISSVTANLRHHFPNAEIDLWCKEYTSPLAGLIPGVNQVIASDPFWDKSPFRPKGSFKDFLSRWWQVRRSRYDVAVVTGACWRSALFTWLARIPSRIGYQKRKSKIFLNQLIPMFSRHKGVVPELQRLLAPLNCPAHFRHYFINPPAKTLSIELHDQVIGLHPFAGHPRRCANLSFWDQLARHLKSDGRRIVWMGAPQELERLKAEYGYQDQEFYTHYVEGQDLLSMARFIKSCQLFIGHDSGPLHIAGAMEVKTLGLYLPSEYQRTFPQGPAQARWVVKDQPADLQLKDLIPHLDQLLASP
ncbi:glycosyltransferase family 9 protein [Pseudobacteriovorax antillogorgiicola]|uniref:ADP-heptose:LPS heptosyltransferase n=1 Tax=Pseudobacteriovorax antillogorgiicola TaxID=1513793 RepID=A0A1Y6CFN7_9BACT|nr:glycosyltransferase family 9 protein [Pseudobacteriovorax antillogorgiicola]TCS49043.1 ADP-heptose:LPS heptosyltransferase [Pseudobacteriovorax antillogorgiicola]SMF52623.1 ADP-heptose:LPS heptosyltransferase [Pseudobacteriovorax antillogorgiicola]